MGASNFELLTAPSLCSDCGESVFTLGGHRCGEAVGADLAAAIGLLVVQRERLAQRRRLIADRARRLRGLAGR